MFQIPQTTDDWLSVSEKFHKRWNYPHCLGAIDGKHVVIASQTGKKWIYIHQLQTDLQYRAHGCR
jgi:hypothetical protein